MQCLRVTCYTHTHPLLCVALATPFFRVYCIELVKDTRIYLRLRSFVLSELGFQVWNIYTAQHLFIFYEKENVFRYCE